MLDSANPRRAIAGYGAQYYVCGCGAGLHYDGTAGKCAPEDADGG